MLCGKNTWIIEHSQRFQPLGRNVLSQSVSRVIRVLAIRVPVVETTGYVFKYELLIFYSSYV